jgi:hypothetical protein
VGSGSRAIPDDAENLRTGHGEESHGEHVHTLLKKRVSAMLRVLLSGCGVLCGYLLAAPLLVAGLPFLIVGLLTRGIARIVEPEFVSWNALVEFDPTFGWKPRANVNTYHISDDVFHTTTDGNGWRGKATIADSQLVVFGDSFVFGYGIDDRHFFADLSSTPRIKAIGACGYNMVQEFLWMQQLSPQLAGKLVVWSIYCGNDLYDNLTPDMCGYRTPFMRKVDGKDQWEVVTSHISPARWFTPTGLRQTNYAGKLAELCGPGALSQRAYSACEFLIGKGRDLCDDVNARLVVLTIPDPALLTPGGRRALLKRGRVDPARFDPDFPDRNIERICATLGVPFIASKRHVGIRCHNRYDCHWNTEGHRRIADILTTVYHGYAALDNANENAMPVSVTASTQRA